TLLDMYGLDHINHTADPDIATITDAFDLSQTERLQGMAGRCLENHRTDPAKPGELGLWHCEEAANQQWVRHGDGTIRNADTCLTATADQKTGLADCDGTPAQTWQPKTDGSLLNPASGRCLTVPGADIANGTPAELRDCDGTTSQKWIVPGYNTEHSLTVDAPSTIKAGSTATVTTTSTNDVSPMALSNASVNLTVPNGWTAEATSPATATKIEPGQSVKTTWAVTVPADAASGPHTLSAQATFKNAKSSAEATSVLSVTGNHFLVDSGGKGEKDLTSDYWYHGGPERTYTTDKTVVNDFGYPHAMQSERWSSGRFGYTFPIQPEYNRYQVELYFQESYFGVSDPANPIGKRVFNIEIDGKVVRENFDIAKDAGGTLHGVKLTYDVDVPADHQLDIDFVPVVSNAKVDVVRAFPIDANGNAL
ncbi:ricin-type beta-trefoil lectin domain protein, partial [Streptomyces yanii]